VLKRDKHTHSVIAASSSLRERERDSSTSFLGERNRPHFVYDSLSLDGGYRGVLAWIQAYSRVFTVYYVAQDQREFAISRVVGMRFVSLYNFSFVSFIFDPSTLRNRVPYIIYDIAEKSICCFSHKRKPVRIAISCQIFFPLDTRI